MAKERKGVAPITGVKRRESRKAKQLQALKVIESAQQLCGKNTSLLRLVADYSLEQELDLSYSQILAYTKLKS